MRLEGLTFCLEPVSSISTFTCELSRMSLVNSVTPGHIPLPSVSVCSHIYKLTAFTYLK
jgi:hypothetical protein